MVCWAQCSDTIDFCPALAALVSPVQNIIFLTSHYFTSFVPIAQQVWQAVITRRLSLNMCLCFLSSLFPACFAKTQYRKKSKQIFPEKELRGYSPNSFIHVSWPIYIFRWSVCLFCCRKIGWDRTWNLTDTWIRTLGLRPSNYFSGNTLIKISLQCVLQGSHPAKTEL